MDAWRLFIAIEVPEPIAVPVARRLKRLPKELVHVKPAVQWHITLQFLGLVPEDTVPGLIRAIEERLMSAEPLSLILAKPGMFGTTKKPRTLWFGLSGDSAKLMALQAKLAGLVEQPEQESFVPHFTVATVTRKAKLSEKAVVAEQFGKISFKKPLWFSASHVVLFRSKITKSNPVYTKLATFSLR